MTGTPRGSNSQPTGGDGATSYDVAPEHYRVSLQPAREGVSVELMAAIWKAMDKAATRLGFRNYAGEDGYWHFERPAEDPDRIIDTGTMSYDVAVPCEYCGHDAREHDPQGCLRGWGGPVRSGFDGCQCEGFAYADATDFGARPEAPNRVIGSRDV